jgi:trigger factor
MEEKITVEEVSKTKFRISLKIPPDEVDSKINTFFETVKKQVDVPGFRKGKAPIAKLKAMFLDQARSPVAQSIIGEYYSIALKDNNINPVGSPVIENLNQKSKYPGHFSFDGEYSVSLVVETLPNIDPSGYIGMELDIPDINMDDLFDKKMMQYREQFAERRQVDDRGAKFGDAVVIDFKGYLDGEAFEGGEAKMYSMEKLGNSNFIPGFEEQLEGVSVGESKEITVTFPDQYHAEHLAGKEATFEVTMQNIVEAKPADVDDDLAMMVGYNNLDELTTKMKEEVEQEHKLTTNQKVEIEIARKLIEINDFDPPETMVNEEFNKILNNIKSKNKIDNIPQQLIDQIRANSIFSVKRAIIMDAIYEKEDDIEISPEELSNLLDQHAKMSGKSKDEIVSALYNSGQMDNFVGVLRVSKVVDFIVDNRKQNESEVESE